MRAGTGGEARPKVGVQESAAHKVGALKSGERVRGSGVGDRREKSGVFEWKEGIGKVREGFADVRDTGGGEEDVKTTIMVGGGGEIKTSGAMLGPSLSEEGRVEGDNKLAGGMDGMGGKVVGGTMETMIGGERGVEGPRSRWLRREGNVSG